MAGEDLRETILGVREAFEHTFECLIELARRIIGIKRLHTERGISKETLGGATFRIERRIAKRHIEIEFADIENLVHHETISYGMNIR